MRGSSKQNRKIGYGLVIVLGCHFLMSFFHTAPNNYKTKWMQAAGNVYAYPFFKQNWKLFGPELPSDNYQLFFTEEGAEPIEMIQYFKSDFKLSLIMPFGNTALGLQTWCALLDHELQSGGSDRYYQNSSAHIIKSFSHLIDLSPHKAHELVVYKNKNFLFAKKIIGYNPEY